MDGSYDSLDDSCNLAPRNLLKMAPTTAFAQKGVGKEARRRGAAGVSLAG
jgi:hypothetical protein